MNNFRNELKNLINTYSKENGSDTPDFILASYLERCLENFDATLVAREAYYGRTMAQNVKANLDECSMLKDF